MPKPVLHYVSYVETMIGGLWGVLINSQFIARYWRDMPAISDWKIGSRVSLAINGLVRWHLQRMAGNFVEPKGLSLLPQGRPMQEAATYSVVIRGLDPRSHRLQKEFREARWIAGSSPAMTVEGDAARKEHSLAPLSAARG
jgi:hypothetical protein